MASDRNRIFQISIESGPSALSLDVESERKVAIADLLEENTFEIVGYDLGPYQLSLSKVDTKLILRVSGTQGDTLVTHFISFRPIQRIIKDYKQICEAHYAAASAGLHPDRLEAIDVARRSLHNDGAHLLIARISSKIGVDFVTARRLFTLVHVSVP